jgi:phosphomevalonate kinase
MGMESVIYVICPGSGGYDAIFVIGLQRIVKYLKEKIGENNVREVSIIFE